MLVRRERVVSGAPGDVWRIVSDPARLPAWWPGVSRVEDASREAWTTVLKSPKGKSVRADYTLVEAREPGLIAWKQELDETPFERLLSSATTTLELEPEEADDGRTRVRLTLDQRPRGWARFSPIQLRAAARRQAEEALNGLAELLGDPS